MSNTTEARALTEARIAKLAIGETISDIAPYRGLRIKRGKKAAVFTYRRRNPTTSKLESFKLGTFGKGQDRLTLAAARHRLEQLKNDPSKLDALANERRAPKKAATTLSDVIDHYEAHLKTKRTEKACKEVGRMFKKCVPNKQREAVSITRADVLAIHSAEYQKGNRVQAGRIVGELSAAFEHAAISGVIPDNAQNPAALAKIRLRAAGVSLANGKKTRVLTDDELTAWFAWFNAAPLSRSHQRVLWLTLHLGCRSGEAIAAKWSDFSNGKWYLAKTKTGIARTIILPSPVWTWLESERKQTPDDEYLAPAPVRGGHLLQKTLTEAFWKLRRDEKFTPFAWAPHDLRRSCRTGLAKIGCPSEIAEAAIGHTAGGIEGVYNLHRYESEAGAWLAKWGEHLEGLRHGH